MLKDINSNYEVVRFFLRENLERVDFVKAYAVKNLKNKGAEVVLLPVLHTLNDLEVELKFLVDRRLVLFQTDIMG